MLRITPIRFFTMAACMLAFSGIAAAQSKVAVVNMQQAVLETDEIKKASADLETKYKPRQAEIQKIQNELQDIQTKLQQGQGKLTPQAESDLNYQGQRRQRDLQRMTQDLQEEVDAERNAILQGTGKKLQDVVRKLAEARGYDVVIDVSSTVFVKPAMDVTKDVIAEFNKANPAAAPAAPAK